MNIIVAVSLNNVIGYQQKLPWHYKEDLAYFKKVTTGSTVIMGRNTYESIGRPLPNRINIVLTQKKIASTQDNLHFCQSWPDAVDLANSFDKDIFVIGGNSLYRRALTTATKMYLTEVRHCVKGDTYFPHWNKSEWVEKQSNLSKCGNLRFVVLQRNQEKD